MPETPEFKIGEWFKDQTEYARENTLMILALLHMALQDKRFMAIETEDCVMTVELRANKEISNGNQEKDE